MKKLILLSIMLLVASFAEAKFALPHGAEILGAGSSLAASYMDALIAKYNKIFPCPQFVYKQSPAALFSEAAGVDRVIDGTVTFAVSDTPLSAATINSAPDCLLQIPFILGSLSIIYRTPTGFTPSNPIWPNHLNISPADLCTIYTDAASTITWSVLLSRQYNGAQVCSGTGCTDLVKAYARSDSATETGLFTQYLDCSNPSGATTACNQYARSANPNGPFFAPVVPTWSTNVLPASGSNGIAQAVAAADGLGGRPNGAIGYVDSVVACEFGFIPGSMNQPAVGFPFGVAGLYSGTGTILDQINYVQPTTTTVQAANPDCIAGTFLCVVGAYPIVFEELFVLYAGQPDSLFACNIAQFIQFALTQGQKICGATPLQTDCITDGFEQLTTIHSAICDPCLEPCNPCLGQTCPLPECPPCKS